MSCLTSEAIDDSPQLFVRYTDSVAVGGQLRSRLASRKFCAIPLLGGTRSGAALTPVDANGACFVPLAQVHKTPLRSGLNDTRHPDVGLKVNRLGRSPCVVREAQISRRSGVGRI